MRKVISMVLQPEKHGQLFGGALTDEALSSSARVLSQTRRGAAVNGLQQWFSPPEAADLDLGGHAGSLHLSWRPSSTRPPAPDPYSPPSPPRPASA